MLIIKSDTDWDDFKALYEKSNVEPMQMVDVLKATKLIKRQTVDIPFEVTRIGCTISLFDVYYDFLTSAKQALLKEVPFRVGIKPEFYLTHGASVVRDTVAREQYQKVYTLLGYFKNKYPDKILRAKLFAILPPKTPSDVKYLMSLVYVGTSLLRGHVS